MFLHNDRRSLIKRINLLQTSEFYTEKQRKKINKKIRELKKELILQKRK